MAGHSKWSKIKRAKGAADKKRGKIFTKCIHEISVAVKEGGGPDPSGNARLRLAIDKARAVNMPSENIDRAIKRASGGDKSVEQFELTYEGYGPGGTAVLVESLTDNKNRTASEVRHAFSKNGGTLGESGCVAWMFASKGVILLKKESCDEEQLVDAALEAGAEDVADEDEFWEVTCDPNSFAEVKNAVDEIGEVESAEITWIPSTRVGVAGKEAEQVMRLLEALEDLDDVMNVSMNCDFEGEGG